MRRNEFPSAARSRRRWASLTNSACATIAQETADVREARIMSRTRELTVLEPMPSSASFRHTGPRAVVRSHAGKAALFALTPTWRLRSSHSPASIIGPGSQVRAPTTRWGQVASTSSMEVSIQCIATVASDAFPWWQYRCVPPAPLFGGTPRLLDLPTRHHSWSCSNASWLAEAMASLEHLLIRAVATWSPYRVSSVVERRWVLPMSAVTTPFCLETLSHPACFRSTGA